MAVQSLNSNFEAQKQDFVLKTQMRFIPIFLKYLLFIIIAVAARGAVHARDSHDPIDKMIQQGESAFMQERYPEALQYFIKAKKMAEQADSFRLEYVATYDMGISYFLISEHGEALNCYYEASKIVEEHNLGEEPRGKIMNGIAGVYFEEKNYEKAQEICQKIYNDAMRSRDSSSCVTNCINLAILGNKEQQFDETERYLRDAKKWMSNKSDSLTLVRIDIVYAEMFFLKGDYENVEKISKRLAWNSTIPNGDRVVLMIYMIKINKERKLLAEAFKYVDEALRISPLRNRPELYDIISDLYHDNGDMSKALHYKDSVVILSDSLMRIQDRKLAENSRIKLELYEMQLEMDRELSKMSMHRQAAFMISVICLLLIAIGLMMFRSQRQKSRQKEQMMQLQIEKEKNEKLIAEKKTQETELVAHYQEEIMKKEIERKKNELATTAMFVSSRNALIADMLAEITNMQDSKSGNQLNELANHLRQLLKNSNEQDNFIINFEAANPDFTNKLHLLHPGLSTSDIRFLSYVRMNLSLKEIATFLNIEPESCKRRKNRLSKKLGLDSSADLYKYVASL